MSANQQNVINATNAFDIRNMASNMVVVYLTDSALDSKDGFFKMTPRKTRQAVMSGVSNATFQFGFGTTFIAELMKKFNIPMTDKLAMQAVYQGLFMGAGEWLMKRESGNVGFTTNFIEGVVGAYGGSALEKAMRGVPSMTA